MNKIKMKPKYVVLWLAYNNKSQEWLANVLQIHKTTLSQILNGQRAVSPKVRQKLMEFFNKEIKKNRDFFNEEAKKKECLKFGDLFEFLF